MLRLPLPFVLAVIVVATAVTIYLYITVVSVPVVADGNFTGTLVAGSNYLWRGSAGQIHFVSNATIALTYYPFGYVVHLNGVPGNVTLDENTKIFKFPTRSYLILYLYRLNTPFLIKLVNATKINGISVFVPQMFGTTETLTPAERSALTASTGLLGHYRLVNVNTNGTHLIFAIAPDGGTSISNRYVALPTPIIGTDIMTSFSGIGFSYIISSETYSGYAMPYVYFVIRPQSNAQVRIYVR